MIRNEITTMVNNEHQNQLYCMYDCNCKNNLITDDEH